MDNYLKIALPKGRLAKDVLDIMRKAGYVINIDLDTRKLVLIDETNKFVYMLVKPIDVLTYVIEGVCDIGVTGKDVIDEGNPDIYELMDLGVGKCRFSVAGRSNQSLLNKPTLKIATKYPKVTTKYYSDKNQKISIVKLSGSVELAPLIGLSDVIVDIVETGNTLTANKLQILEEMYELSARLISNKSSYRVYYDTITTLQRRIEKVV